MPTQVTYSEVWLSNGALQRIGAMTLIQSLDPTQDSSTNAIACGQWYPQCRDAILTDYPWTWAQGSAQLSQLNTMVPASPEAAKSGSGAPLANPAFENAGKWIAQPGG